MELAAGKVKSKPVKSAHGATDVVQWTFATAAANHLNVVRAFAHGTDSSFPLQTSAGAALACMAITRSLKVLCATNVCLTAVVEQATRDQALLYMTQLKAGKPHQGPRGRWR